MGVLGNTVPSVAERGVTEMSTLASGPAGVTGRSGTRAKLPSRAVGWWAIGLAVLGLVPWVVLPMITVAFRDTYPVTDTWVMPAIGLVLTDLAAVFNVLCIWLWKQRSVLNIIAAGLIIAAAVFIALMVLGGG